MKIQRLDHFVEFCLSFREDYNLEIVHAVCPTRASLAELVSALVDADLWPVWEHNKACKMLRLSNDLRLFVAARPDLLPEVVGKSKRRASAVYDAAPARELQYA